MDAKRSIVSRILRIFAPAPANDLRSSRRREDGGGLQANPERERKPADSIDTFVRSWQFPGQW